MAQAVRRLAGSPQSRARRVRTRPESDLQRTTTARDAGVVRASARPAGPTEPDIHELFADGPVAVLDAPLLFVMPLAGPFGALLLLAMAWLSLP
jgi:hypothetical protein